MIPRELREFGLVQPQVQVKRRLIITTEAETGCGKSSLMLRTAPRPLLHIDIDMNSEDIEEKWVGEDIWVHRVVLPDPPKEDTYFELLKKTYSLAKTACEKGLIRSINWDTGDKLWDWVQIAYLGSKEFGQNSRTEYRSCNAAMESLFTLAKKHRVNFCMSHHMKNEMIKVKGKTGKDSVADTGRRVRAGWKSAVEQSQLHLRLSKDPTEDGIDKFKAEIIKCTVNSDLEGLELSGKDISIKKLGELVYPQTKGEKGAWE